MEKNTLESERNLVVSKYIIGIGASAGGMEAIHHLFDHMPANTGFSFVVVQHLSPDHKSLLSDLLAKHTKMRVEEASDNAPLEPDCIYVIPSRKVMTIQNGRLQLAEKSGSRSPNDTIDVFFRSLAKDQKQKGVGIVLSGTGSDGSKGLEDIKKAGGIVIVQDPATAAFDGMPVSAVDSVTPDIVAPPEVIGHELIELIKEPPLLKSLASIKEEDENILLEILDMLRRSTRYDFDHYKRPTLFRRLSKRMSELNLADLKHYRDYLTEHPQELKTLSQEFLINVTRFFRDPEAFESLRTEVLPAIFANKHSEDPVKVWVVACSSGEEAYSIAMLCLEHIRKLSGAFNIKIFATDIDTEALETASRGIYNTNIEKDIPAPLLSRYFVREGNFLRVTGELRKLVVFANHDVVKDPPFSRLDLITCRNMFIYMNNMLQAKAMKKFHFALKVNSFLMLGPSESIGILKEATQEINRKWKVYRCTSKQLSDSDTMFVPLENTIVPKIQGSKKSQTVNLTEILKDTLLADRKVALILIDKDFNLKQATGSYKSFLNLPEENLDFNILKLVNTDLSIALGVTVRKAIAENKSCVMKNVVIHSAESSPVVNIVVKPYLDRSDYPHAFISILVEEAATQVKVPTARASSSLRNGEQVAALEKELIETRQNLQAVIEEMESVNEELQSSNEEMISTNEELQSTNEELQSLNEELHTVSAEHQLKIKELFELNDDLNNYFNNSEIGQVLVDSTMVIRKFSPASKRMINLIDSDIGRSLYDITSNVRGLNFADEVSKVVLTGAAVEKEVETIADEYYIMRINPYVRRDKTTDGVVVNFVNISQSKRLSSIIEGVFKSSPNGITAKRAVRDNQERIVDFEYLAANASAERMFGVGHGALVGKRFLDTFDGSGKKEYFNIYKKVVETGTPAKAEFFHDAGDRWFETTIVKMLDGIVTTHIDITDRRRNADLIAKNYEDLKLASEKLSESNSQLERSNFDLMQFASVASHDLKEPLRKIQAFGNILQSKIKDKLSEGEINYFSKIVSASNRMQALIDDVLTLSKLSNGNNLLVNTDLNRVIKQIIDDLEITIKEKNATIKAGNLPSIEAVPGQMHQVFQNLISNALKFTNKKSPVITIDQMPVPVEFADKFGINTGHYVYLVVRDNGIGFENEYREKIFGIFQRLHGRNYEGTGIGLAIARKIIENHGGFIFADGEVDRGAIFHICLPAKIRQSLPENKVVLESTP